MSDLSNTDTVRDSQDTLSSYALITAERLLSLLGIHLNRDLIAKAMRNKQGLYDSLLSAPLKNVLNGIILQQATDYQVYLQKLFVDYLMSGVTTLSEESPGAGTRADIDSHREYVMTLGTRFQEQEHAHLTLIADTQKALIELSKTILSAFDDLSQALQALLKKKGLSIGRDDLSQAIHLSMIDLDIGDANLTSHLINVIAIQFKQSFTELESRPLLATLNLDHDFKNIADTMLAWQNKSTEQNKVLCEMRSEFFDAIVRMQKLLNLLPGNPLQETHLADNLDAIKFDRNIGA